jgi:hypothetical protein
MECKLPKVHCNKTEQAVFMEAIRIIVQVFLYVIS